MTSRWYTEEQEPANEWHENNYNNHEQVRGNIDDNELKRKHKRDDAKLEQGNDTEADVRTADKREARAICLQACNKMVQLIAQGRRY